MTTTSDTTWFITGCSTGLGRAFAEAVLAAGGSVVVTARDAARVQDIADTAPDRALALALDVTDPDAVTAAVAAAEERFGRVDVLVNNAGYGYRAAVEEGEPEAVRTLFDTHVHGPTGLIRAVLPGMRARGTGTIVNISSIGARISPEGSGYYAAVKAALEALSLSLRKEVAPLGIDVMVVEPGGFRTDFAGRSLTQSATPDRGLRRHRRQAAHRARHRPRHTARRPGEGGAGAHHRGRVRRDAVHAAARQRRVRRVPSRARRAPLRGGRVGVGESGHGLLTFVRTDGRPGASWHRASRPSRGDAGHVVTRVRW